MNASAAIDPNTVLGEQLRLILLEMLGKGAQHAELVVGVGDVQMRVLLTLASTRQRGAGEVPLQ